MLNIIHLERRVDRFKTLMEELQIQQISDFKIWQAIDDQKYPVKGILKSHQQIVAFAKQTKLKQITIAEDDIHFTAKGAWKYYLLKQPDSFDLYLGGIIWGDINSENLVNDFAGATLYTISERFYDIFLSLKPGMDFDRQLARMGTYKVCYPMPVTQHSGFSDNSKREINITRFISRYQFFTG